MHQLVRRTKEEYDVAIKMYEKTGDPYWSGRMSLAKELLNVVRRKNNNRNCLLCNVSSEECEHCLKKINI